MPRPFEPTHRARVRGVDVPLLLKRNEGEAYTEREWNEGLPPDWEKRGPQWFYRDEPYYGLVEEIER